MIRRAWLFVMLASAGCAETAAQPAASTTPHHAGAWQQFCEQAWSVQHASQLAAARGSEGWELVAMYNGVLCFKRPANEAHRPPIPSAPPSTAQGVPGVPYVPLVRDPGF